MRKVILMMLLAVVSRDAMAEWTEFGNNKDKTIIVFVDTTTRIIGYKVKMWRLLNFTTAQKVVGKPFMSLTSQGEYDCKEKQMRTLYSSYFTKTMGGGSAVTIDANPTNWAPASPGSIDDSLWKFACGMD